ncbi:hypothetical protein D9M68_785420 [compost metagenome]
MVDLDGMASDTTKNVTPAPKPEPKPIQLKEVEITTKLNKNVEPVRMEMPIYIGTKQIISTLPRAIQFGVNIARDFAAFHIVAARLWDLSQSPIVKSNEEKTADELIPGRLKKSPSYNPKYGNKTRKELEALGKQGDQAAKKMKKLMDDTPRLLDKLKNK